MTVASALLHFNRPEDESCHVKLTSEAYLDLECPSMSLADQDLQLGIAHARSNLHYAKCYFDTCHT